MGRCVFFGRTLVADGQVASVCDIDALHYRAEYRAVCRCVMQTVVVDEIVYHLVYHRVIDCGLRQVKPRADAQFESRMTAHTVSIRRDVRHALSEIAGCVTQAYGYGR